jgi:hypothetical protein
MTRQPYYTKFPAEASPLGRRDPDRRADGQAEDCPDA